MAVEWLLLGFAFLASLAGTYGLRCYALHRQVLDVPNERSSHTHPTPRGGGLAIVVSVLMGIAALHYLGHLPDRMFYAVLGGGLLVAGVGFWDDHQHIPAAIRLLVHFCAAVWTLFWLGDAPPLDLGWTVLDWGWIGNVAAAFALVWLLNLYNFMDGIDGIAAGEAIFVAGCGALFLVGVSGIGWALAVLAMGCAGFLVFNWPPARIFMGDVGSGFLGFIVGVLALTTIIQGGLTVWVWVILLGVFLVDATVTLLVRMKRGASVHHAHRSHVYQRLSRKAGSHLRVTLLVLAVNLLWLLPFALLARAMPAYSVGWVAAALGPLVIAAIWLGAGQEDGN